MIDLQTKTVYDPQTECWFDTETGFAYDRPKGSEYSEEELEERWAELLFDPERLIVIPIPPGKEAPFVTTTGLTVNTAKWLGYDPITATWFNMKNGTLVNTLSVSEYSDDKLQDMGGY